MKKCWYCKSGILEPVEGKPFKKCPKCGATWNETPPPGMPLVLETYKDNYGSVRTHYKVTKRKNEKVK